MELGWIDFSLSERDRVLNVLDSLADAGTLDELGVAPIRDGFSDLFFPGTSTLQTRAKYFLLVPYACKDVELSGETDARNALRKLRSVERETSRKLIEKGDGQRGVIGSSSANGKGDWIKSPPSALYWSGLRRYGIFKENCSVTEYLKAVCAVNAECKGMIERIKSNADEDDADDKDAGKAPAHRFFSVPTYTAGWKDDLSLRLTAPEAEFLKDKITRSAPDSLLAYLLKGNDREALGCKTFGELPGKISDKTLRERCDLAVSFDRFLYVLRTVYNLIVSGGAEGEAKREADGLLPEMKAFSGVDFDFICKMLNVNNGRLKNFLDTAKSAMESGDAERLKACVAERERSIKGASRARTATPGAFGADKWFGGRHLDYRFSQAKRLIEDIAEGEAENVRS